MVPQVGNTENMDIYVRSKKVISDKVNDREKEEIKEKKMKDKAKRKTKIKGKEESGG